ncbi:MAG: hypothetical protein ABFR32_01965 [Bacteroidota bacterium]
MIGRINISVIFFLIFIGFLNSCSQEKSTESQILNNDISSKRTAEELVASKKTSEMSYKQLMNIFNSGSVMVHQGILLENKQLVIEGAKIILNHAAPKEKPWFIMNEPDQKNFKSSLLTYDIILDNYAKKLMEEAKNEDWLKASKTAHELMNSCIVCHSMWKYKVK